MRARCADLAHRLFQSLQPLHRLPPALGKLLEAAAYLHDIGHFVSDTSHHKHSYYLVAHSDLPGFTDTERQMIALLCRYHRKSMPTPRHSPFQTIDPESRRAINMLAPLLRIADSLDRSHEQRVADLQVQIRNGTVTLALDSNPDTGPGDLGRGTRGRRFSRNLSECAPVDAGAAVNSQAEDSRLRRGADEPSAHHAGLSDSPRRKEARLRMRFTICESASAAFRKAWNCSRISFPSGK